MTKDGIVDKGKESSRTDVIESLNTEARMLAYLRAVALESGDNPKIIAAALRNVERARESLEREDPLRTTAVAKSHRLAKRSS